MEKRYSKPQSCFDEQLKPVDERMVIRPHLIVQVVLAKAKNRHQIRTGYDGQSDVKSRRFFRIRRTVCGCA